MTEIGVIREIRRSSGHLSVEWKIGNFSSLSSEEDDLYSSPDFVFADAKWRLRMFPNVVTKNAPSGFILLSLQRIDRGPSVNIHYKLGIEGEAGLKMRRKGESEFSCSDWESARFDSLTRQVFTDQQSILVPNDQLTVICSLKRVVPSPSRADASIQTDEDFREDEALTEESNFTSEKKNASIQTDEEFREDRALNEENHFTSEKQRLEKVVEDISQLLKSGEHSDTTVQVGEVEFKVHRNILSARSSVLSAMLLHDTAERASNRIVVQDCEPDVFGEYLQYLYSGSVRSLAEIDVFGLFRVADKYLADDLKRQCLKHIRDTLSVQTFCDTVKLALTHGKGGLLQFAIDFATGNIRSIIRSVEWQNFNRDYPTEANEILIKSLGPE